MYAATLHTHLSVVSRKHLIFMKRTFSFLLDEHLGCSGRIAGCSENGDPASVRKVHKADREKLRRDRLNEQFGELAGVLGKSFQNLKTMFFRLVYQLVNGDPQCKCILL